ncbi:MAG: hypothetical protein G01um101438_332 [Parcubacteria group bacterium Gr01-1014_38]|nr:MAG: hypothetical protein G01um101438_332 [Parcubacteria group bacterium Gr01-1014_38]
MTREQAKQLVQEALQRPFDKGGFVRLVRNLLNHLEDAPFTYSGNTMRHAYANAVKSLERIGKYEDPEGRKIDVLVVNLRHVHALDHARTMQRNFIAWYLNGSRGDVFKDAALVAFHADDAPDWRFSLVRMDYRLTKSGEKVKAVTELTPARRFSFLVGQHEKTHTAQKQLLPILEDDTHDPLLSNLEQAFSIETVTKEFFGRYRDLFLETKEALDKVARRDNAVREEFSNKEVDTTDFAKKLLGQIVFLYFLQKKGWFGVARTGKWGSGPKNFLRQLFEKKHGDYKNFFNDILEPLFYEALAKERDNDFYSRFNCKIPFLNGGLFDPIYNYDWVHTDILLPDELFSNTLRTKEGDIGAGILDVFDRYNFTVKEDEPLEKDVAVDPEMLGKVFENLLEVKDRKSKGTYYTPREIVHYMCQESLVNYLAAELEGMVGREDIETLIKYGETAVEHDRHVEEGGETPTYQHRLPEAVRARAKVIDDKLADIRVCDPAVGSGAFPVGMMNEVVRTRNALTNYVEDKDDRSMYEFKRHAIQSSLYGVDIDPGAVEIAKLRLWLSLVVDEEDIKKIKPLPNLDYKMVQGDSLSSVQKNLFNQPLFNKLEELKPKFFEETNARKKQEYRRQIDELIDQITRGHKDFDYEVYFSEVFHEKKGFDVAIANPPYLQIQKMAKSEKERFRKIFRTFSKTGDIYCLFYERAIQILKQDGTLTFITSNSWLRARYGELLRKLLIEKANPVRLINYEDARMFEHAIVETNILIAQKSQWNGRLHATTVKNNNLNALPLDEYVKGNTSVISDLGVDSWNIADKASSGLKKKIESHSVSLKDLNVSVYRGITTGFVEAFVVDEEIRRNLITQDEKSAEVIKPVLRGQDAGRYFYAWKGLWLITLQSGWTNRNRGGKSPESFFAETYPAVHEYLKGVGSKIKIGAIKAKGKGLYGRDDQGDYWWELRDCDFYSEFEKEKVIWGELSDKPKFTYDDQKYYALDTLFVMTGESLKYLLAILNSKISEWYFAQISTSSGMGTTRWKKYKIEQFPIKKISKEEQKPIVHLIDKILSLTMGEDYSASDTKQAKVREYERQIDQLVYKLYGLTPEEISIVEQGNG